MASIDRPEKKDGGNADNTPKTGSVENKKQLEQTRKDLIGKIKNIQTKYPERSKLTEEAKSELRRLYSQLMRTCRKLADCSYDEEREQYMTEFKKAQKMAESFGSAVKAIEAKITMDDIAGLDEVKTVVKSFLFMAQNPHLMKAYHMEGGLGMMLYGAPGTGKTMFAEAVASAMKLPLFIVTPADIFKSYVGQSEAAVKEIFEELDACEDGAILFVDECESIFSVRKKDTQDYKSAVTTELLQRMNGFGVNGARRIMIGATNRPDEIDPAYLRFKRFSHLVHVTPPDEDAIKAIFALKLKKLEEGLVAPEVTLDALYALCKKHMAPRKVQSVNQSVTPTANYGIQGLDYAMAAGKAVNDTPLDDDYFERRYSGADISGIVEEACRLALVELENESKCGDGFKTDVKPKPLTLAMFEKAFAKIPPSITHSVLKTYESFR